MADCKHDWKLCRKWSLGVVAQCHNVNCRETLGVMELNRRLNEHASFKTENELLMEYITAVLEEAIPIIHLHQVRNINNQAQFPRCNKAWAKIPEALRAILETDSILKLAKGEPK